MVTWAAWRRICAAGWHAPRHRASFVSPEGLSSERTATPERHWDSGLRSARSGGTSLGLSRARSAVGFADAVARSELEPEIVEGTRGRAAVERDTVQAAPSEALP